jgi:hypothetical protein
MRPKLHLPVIGQAFRVTRVNGIINTDSWEAVLCHIAHSSLSAEWLLLDSDPGRVIYLTSWPSNIPDPQAEARRLRLIS